MIDTRVESAAPTPERTFCTRTALAVGPVPLWWLLLGLLVYPAIFGVGWWYVRLAQRNEDRFAALLDEE